MSPRTGTYYLGGTYYPPGYVSSGTYGSGCCHCAASCPSAGGVDDTCSYFDAPISAGSCDVSGSVTCDVAEADCTGTYAAPGAVSSDSGCCHCMASCDGATGDDGCSYPDKIHVPPSPPPTPPTNPPAPPQLCIPGGAPSSGGTLLAKQAAPADPVNEPCYTHSSCKGYTPGVGPIDSSGYICCVTVGTCDSGYVSNSGRYYEGGCIGVNYASNSSMTSSTSTSTDFPSTVEGCVKQGECNLPFLEQIKHWTATGGGLTTATVPDDVMDRLLVGATESYAHRPSPKSSHAPMHASTSACNSRRQTRSPVASPQMCDSPRLPVRSRWQVRGRVPRRRPVPAHGGGGDELRRALRDDLGRHLVDHAGGPRGHGGKGGAEHGAQCHPATQPRLHPASPPATPGSTKFHQVPSDATSPAPNAQGVAAANVDITASAGSVVLAISIGYDSATEATSAATTLETVMATADDATAMLTTTALAVTATTVTAPVTGAGAAVPSPPSPPPPPPPVSPDDDGLSVGVVAGIAVGGSVVVIAIIVGVMLAMKKKKAVSPSKSAGSA